MFILKIFFYYMYITTSIVKGGGGEESYSVRVQVQQTLGCRG
jgi:hypothetical protein